jgi:hypothetical protein
MKPNLIDALKLITPDSGYAIHGDMYDYDGLVWMDDNTEKPTREQVTETLNFLQKEYESVMYKEQRKDKYPSIPDQLDTLWHMMDDGTIPGKDSKWYNDILDVKNKYPKP